MANRPLAKALHTVTSTARVATHLRSTSMHGATPHALTLAALSVLGYGLDQLDQSGPLFLACVAAVAKG